MGFSFVMNYAGREGKEWKLFKNLFAVCSSSISDLISRMLVDLQSTDPCEKARALAVSRSALYCRNLVQEGTFGRVYKGTLELAGREQEVIIKTVTGILYRHRLQHLSRFLFPIHAVNNKFLDIYYVFFFEFSR